jgi:cysteinyl-tRNA synthetase
MITKTGESFLCTLADEDLWRVFAAIGVDAVHTGPVKQAGGISGWDVTPSVDGHFDRISNRIDEVFGTEAEFLVEPALEQWRRADELRDEILALGYVLEDSKGGTRARPKS